MRRLTTTSLFSALLAGTAFAADVSVQGPYDWTGAYVGLNGGLGLGNSSYADYIPDLPGPTPNPYYGWDFAHPQTTGALLGAQIGYRHQIGKIVLGIEGSADWANLKGTDYWHFPDGNPPNKWDTYTTRQNFLGSVEGQIGFTPADRLLVYGTGGIAFGGFDHTNNCSPQTGLCSATFPHRLSVGWTLGAGADYGLSDNWVVGVRYNYNDFGHFMLVGKADALGQWPIKFREATNAFTLRVNYRF